MFNPDIPPIPGRDCGSCTVCCTLMAIDKPEMQKQAGVACRHCAAGCTIYDTRPSLCRDYFCGWRQLPILDDSWRPDRSGVFVELEPIEGQMGLKLVLAGNPLKIVRSPWFIDFVITGVRGNIMLEMGIPGPEGFQGASLLLNTREMAMACDISRAQAKSLLEVELKRLQSHHFEPRVLAHSGHNFGVDAP